MKYDPNQRIADLTIGEYVTLQKGSIKSLVKWGLLVFYGIPVAIIALAAIFGLVMVRLAGTA